MYESYRQDGDTLLWIRTFRAYNDVAYARDIPEAMISNKCR